MSTEIQKTDKPKLPTLEQLIQEDETSLKQNALTVLLNQNPHEKWLKPHPTAKFVNSKGEKESCKYLSIERVEYLLTAIFHRWWVEVRDTKLIANSVAVTVRLYVVNPITKETEWMDGVGATPIQTDSGAGATDWTKVKSAGVQMALPSAETYAIKDAAEKFGKIFGKDVNRQGHISYDSLLKYEADPEITYNQVSLIESLLLTSSIAEEEKQKIEGELDGMRNSHAEEVINRLKENQIDPINSGQSYNQGDIQRKLKREIG